MAIFRREPHILMGALNAGWVDINHDSDLYLASLHACCQSCDLPGVISKASLDHSPTSLHLSLVVSGGVC